jgi:hypothetical protein
MMQKRWLIAFGVSVLVVAGIAFIPASLIQSQLNARALNVSMRDASGTVWIGRGVLVIVPGDARNITNRDANRNNQLVIPLQWSIAPLSLLRGRLGFDVSANATANASANANANANANKSARAVKGSLTAEVGFTNLQIRNADLTLAMEELARLSRDAALFKPAGSARILSATEPVRIDYRAPHNMHGNIKLNANDVRMRAGALFGLSVPLGSYAGLVTFKDQRIDYRIDESKGMLALSGSGHITRDATREFRYDGFASTLPGSPVWLLGALSSVGKLTSDGRVKIDVNTKY